MRGVYVKTLKNWVGEQLKRVLNLSIKIKINHMKKLVSFLSIACIAISATAQETLYLSKPLTTEAVNRIEAKTSGGSIGVAGNHDQDARLEIYVSLNRHNRTLSKEEIDTKIKDDYDFSIDVSGGKLTVIALPKHNFTNWERALNISFKIFVPQNVATDLTTSGGSISLSNLSGTEQFKTSGGNLTVERLAGKTNGKTSGGSIRVTDSKDEIDLSTSGGSVHASNCMGKIQLRTAGGSITLQDLKGDVNASNSGGSVVGNNIGGDLIASTSGGNLKLMALQCSLDASTSGGSINAQVTEPRDFVKVSTSGGHIDLSVPKDKGYDLRLYGNKMDRNFSLHNFSGTVQDDKIEGTINDGGIPVTAHDSGGKINLSFD
jgi:DUF4097 and DUF4098 domain-containing protein YvlB